MEAAAFAASGRGGAGRATLAKPTDGPVPACIGAVTVMVTGPPPGALRKRAGPSPARDRGGDNDHTERRRQRSAGSPRTSTAIWLSASPISPKPSNDRGRSPRRSSGPDSTTRSGWLENELRPHLTWEAIWLYPEFDAIAGTPWATRLPRYEHRQIEAGIAALQVDSARWFGHSTPQTDADLVAHLSAIRALIAAHIEREDRFLLPLLEERVEAVG